MKKDRNRSTAICFKCFLILALFAPQLAAQETAVSDKPINNSEEVFRFAVVSDRTGGMRGGVFSGAMDKVEIMQPEFVMSVGDLIDGYTEDPEVWNAQWNEFDTIIDKLSLPFYYVPGNHDTSNELLTQVWRERHGPDYYHFVYKDVLFLVLNTDEVQGGGMAQPQIDYFGKVLQEHQDARWTLLFMHRPVWSYGDRMGYDLVEAALGDRNYTLFSGHHHHYRYKVHNGMEHFTLATTGGGSWMRNPDVGELDHITWVTMKADGPKVAHIDINGIYDKELVPEDDYEDIQVLRQGNWLNVLPARSAGALAEELPVTLVFRNNSERMFTISGQFEEENGIYFEPRELYMNLEAGKSEERVIKAFGTEGMIDIDDLNNHPVFIEMSAGFSREDRNDISLSTASRVLVDRERRLNSVNSEIQVDGDITEWKLAEWISVDNPQFIQEDWDWKGRDDGRFEFAVSLTGEFLNVAVQFFDQKMISDPKQINTRQDKFFIQLDADTTDEEYHSFEIARSDTKERALIKTSEGFMGTVGAAVSERGRNQTLEFRVSLKELTGQDPPESLRINIGIMDHDRPENTKPSVMWWRPLWNSDQNYPESGIFKLMRSN